MPQMKRDATSEVPDCTCWACRADILPIERRWRCHHETCDSVHVCKTCMSHGCPSCGGGLLYCDSASPLQLRMQVFRESFSSASNAASVVHPWAMVDRALRVYGERPLLGEPRADGSVRWWTYHQCGDAARRLARALRQRCSVRGGGPAAVLICASNSPGWLLMDWACALAQLPSIVADASMQTNVALEIARKAARRVGRTIRAICVDADCIQAWQDLLDQVSDGSLEGDLAGCADRGNQGCHARSCGASAEDIWLMTTAEAYCELSPSSTDQCTSISTAVPLPQQRELTLT